MNRFQPKRFRLVSTARVVLATVLLFAFLSGVVPLASVSAGSMCMRECCAARAPHAAGSCRDGSCPATLRKYPRRAENHRAGPAQGEPLCGLHRKVLVKSLARMPSDGEQSRTRFDQTRVSAAAFGMPCEPDCRGCASGFTNSSRQRNSAGIADAVRPRGPAAIDFSNSGYHRTQIRKALCRQCAPRGPPLSFS